MFPQPRERRGWLLAILLASVACAEQTHAANPAPSATALHTLIDQHIASGFAQWKARPAAPCSDAEFIRRATLDFTGNIPTATETRTFLAETAADKRARLIDQLLESEAYAQRMAIVFDVMLMERRPDKYIKTPAWRGYLADSFAKNKPLNVLVSEILTGSSPEEELRPAAKFILDRNVDKDTLVIDIGRLFLGVDMQCAQCHDHPGIDDYLHQHYHGLSVFVAGSKIFKQPDGQVVLQEMVMREVEFASVFDPATTKKTGPRLLDALMEVPELPAGEEYVEKPSSKVRAVPKFSLRKLLAQKLPSDETPEFARNMTNRLWAMLMGRGLVHPLDMHHSANPASHPALLKLLAQHFRDSKYDTREFLRELALSKTYARSSMIPQGVTPEQVPPASFAVANMKGLSPEQLFHSLLRATGSQQLFTARIDESLREDKEAFQKLREDSKLLMAAREERRAARVKEFITLFGGAAGRPEGAFQASLSQALFMANSETIIAWLQPGENNLTEQLLKISEPKKLIEQAYFAVLSRGPSAEELAAATTFLAEHQSHARQAVIELAWTLLASAEFRLNH